MTKLFNEKYYEHLTEEDLANEIWKPITGFPNYMISNCGRCKSLNYRRSGKEYIMSPTDNGYGYLKLNLSNSTVKTKTFKLHKLVAECFCENDNPEKNNAINHIDGCKHNNRASNLEYCTQSHNIKEAFRLGLNHNLCKLSDEDVSEIRTRYSNGNVLQKDLAEEFDISRAQISAIINFKKRSRPTPAIQ